jgi:drug/metabolite transporter (DMT)-like permease
MYASGAMGALGAGVAVSSVLTAYPVLGGQALRYALAAALLRAFGRGSFALPTLRELGRLLLLAATGLAAFNVLLIGALREADAGSVGIVVGCAPVVLALAGPLLARRRPSARVLAAAVVVSSGAALVQFSGEPMSTRALLLAGGVLACEAAFSLLAIPLLPRLGPLAVSTYTCALAVPGLLAAGWLVHGASLVRLPGPREGLALGYMALVVTAGGFVAWYAAIARLGVDRAGLFAGLVPVAALAAAAVLGASPPTPARVLGAILVGAGVVVGTSGSSREADPSA